MKKINLAYFYLLSEDLHPLTQWSGEKLRNEVFSAALRVRTLLEKLLEGNFYNLKVSCADARMLYKILGIYSELGHNPHPIVSSDEIHLISGSALTLETALIAELGSLPSYLVTPKGGYSVDILISSPENVFPSDLLTYIPNVKHDIEQAAKCLAFEVPTAAGFHLYRVLESVLRVYWVAVTKGAESPGKTMGDYLKALEAEKKGDKKIKSTLNQIKNLHRNPIAHPDINLSIEEAIEFKGIVYSAVSRMLSAIKESGYITLEPISMQIEN